MTSRLWLRRAPVALTLLAMVLLVLCLRAGGGGPVPSPPGIPDPGELTGWGLPVSRLLADLAALWVVGGCLVGVLLSRRSDPSAENPRWLGMTVAASAAFWAVMVSLEFVLSVSDVFARPVNELDLTQLGGVLTDTALGRGVLIQLGLLVLIVSLSWTLRHRLGALALFGLSIAALVPPVLSGHAATSSDRSAATVSLVLHIATVSVWVGGLAALAGTAALTPQVLRDVVPRFSTIAAWCFGLVFLTGLANATIRLATNDVPFNTGYGKLVLVKVVLLGALGGFGLIHRLRTVPGLKASGDTSAWRLFGRVAVAELCIMVATIGVAVALSRTPPPAQNHGHAAACVACPVVLADD